MNGLLYWHSRATLQILQEKYHTHRNQQTVHRGVPNVRYEVYIVQQVGQQAHGRESQHQGRGLDQLEEDVQAVMRGEQGLALFIPCGTVKQAD